MPSTESSVTLRPVGPGDEPLLYELYAGTRQAEMERVDWSADRKDAFLRMQFRAQQRHYQTEFPRADFNIVLFDERPVGRLYVARGADEIRIVDIALLPEHRNRGIGRFLLQRLIEEAARGGLPLRIHVERSNPALRLYGRLGFVVIADQGVYLLMEWRK